MHVRSCRKVLVDNVPFSLFNILRVVTMVYVFHYGTAQKLNSECTNTIRYVNRTAHLAPMT